MTGEDDGQLNLQCAIFMPDARAYYRLERLWEDGQNRLELPFLLEEEAV